MTDYKKAIEAAVDKEKELLGKKCAVGIARKAEGVDFDDEGQVVKLEKDGLKALENVVDIYTDNIGEVILTMMAKKMKEEGLDNIDLPEPIKRKMEDL